GNSMPFSVTMTKAHRCNVARRVLQELWMMVEDRPALYAHRIHEVHPDFDVATIRLNDHGQNNDVVVVNEGFIFRFPRYTEGIKRLERETAILRAIQHRVALAVPNPIYASFEALDVGQVFMGYSMIPGEPLWRGT